MLKAFDTTGIGSLPYQGPDEAINLIMETTTIPFWPQLPKRSPLEQMVPQYSEGLPGLRIEGDRVFIEPSQEELNRFYEEYTEDKTWPMSPEAAGGFYRFLEIGKERDLSTVKGHITGPVTLSLALKFSDGRALFYDEEYRELVLMVLKGKALWQIRKLKEISDNVIVFIDEPILTALGTSSYISVSQQEAMDLIRQVVKTIKSEGAVAGLHCCGRADWKDVLSTGIDILNFDAYGYFDSLIAAGEDIEGFLSSGGILAWGIVPTTEAIHSEDRDSLVALLERDIKRLSEFIPERTIMERSILTPSCGAGSRTVEEAEKVFRTLRQMGEALR